MQQQCLYNLASLGRVKPNSGQSETANGNQIGALRRQIEASRTDCDEISSRVAQLAGPDLLVPRHHRPAQPLVRPANTDDRPPAAAEQIRSKHLYTERTSVHLT
eukprot:scaffold275639_cov16-Prasinocladus_malaysianus.AAC.1